MSTAAPTNPPTSKLPAIAKDGNAGVETVKRSKYWPLHEMLNAE